MESAAFIITSTLTSSISWVRLLLCAAFLPRDLSAPIKNRAVLANADESTKQTSVAPPDQDPQRPIVHFKQMLALSPCVSFSSPSCSSHTNL